MRYTGYDQTLIYQFIGPSQFTILGPKSSITIYFDAKIKRMNNISINEWSKWSIWGLWIVGP